MALNMNMNPKHSQSCGMKMEMSFNPSRRTSNYPRMGIFILKLQCSGSLSQIEKTRKFDCFVNTIPINGLRSSTRKICARSSEGEADACPCSSEPHQNVEGGGDGATIRSMD